MHRPSRRNLYPGINPHLNSALQLSGWRGFHALHLADLARTLDATLPDHYYTASEVSLQITVSDDPEGELSSLLIYHISDDGNRPVTRIELLSPANLPGGSHHLHYLSRRDSTLKSGLCLVEIDYLHHQAPVDERLPDYTAYDAGAHPYAIVVSVPRPTYQRGQMRVYGFGVMDALPVIPVPLAGDEAVTVAFTDVYNQTFSSYRQFWQQLVDYTREPAPFNRYHQTDQQAIRQHMQALAAGPSENEL